MNFNITVPLADKLTSWFITVAGVRLISYGVWGLWKTRGLTHEPKRGEGN